jgi:hypothetical protein
LKDKDGCNEGIWAWVNDDAMKLHDNDSRSDVYNQLAVTANMSLSGVPWGCIIPIKFNGVHRATSSMKDIIAFSDTPQYYKPAYIKSLKVSIKEMKKDSNEKMDKDTLEMYQYILKDEPILEELESLLKKQNKKGK